MGFWQPHHLALWIYGFLLGAIIGRLDSQVYHLRLYSFEVTLAGLIVLSILYALNQTRFCAIVLGILAFIWGFSHHAPEADKSYKSAQVINFTPTTIGISSNAADLLVLTPSRQVFHARGQGSISTQGSIQSMNFATMFSPAMTVFIPTNYATENTLYSDLFFNAKQFLLRPFNQISKPSIQALGKSMVFGTQEFLPPHMRTSFKALGIIHLLAVSGIQLTLIAYLLRIVLKLPFQLLYALRLISAYRWFTISISCEIVTVCLCLFYCGMCGMPQACLRATVCFAVWRLYPIFFGHAPVNILLIYAFTLQTLFFPIAFFSEGTIMSWSAIIFLISFGKQNLSREHVILKSLKTQLMMSLLSGACFGQFSLIGIGLNLLIIPIFPLIFGSLLLLACFHNSQIASKLLVLPAEIFLNLSEKSYWLVLKYPFLSLNFQEFTLWNSVVRSGSIIGISWLLLREVKNLSITATDRN